METAYDYSYSSSKQTMYFVNIRAKSWIQREQERERERESDRDTQASTISGVKGGYAKGKTRMGNRRINKFGMRATEKGVTESWNSCKRPQNVILRLAR